MNQDVVGLLVALGAGLLMGIERERRKGVGAQRGFAGVRSFTLVCVGGALAVASGIGGLPLLGAALVAGLALISHQRSRGEDPGITTEVALFVAYLIGVTAIGRPALAAGVAALATMLLAARERLHEFSVRAISPQELHDALLLTAIALVLLPLLPDAPLVFLGVNPRSLGGLVVVLLAAQAAGHVGRRLLGARHGLALAGLASGFVSSTATIAAMGARYRDEIERREAPGRSGEAGPASGIAAARAKAPGATIHEKAPPGATIHEKAPPGAFVTAALLSNVATMLQLLLVAAAIRPAWLKVLWLPAAAGALAALLFAAPGLFASGARGPRVPWTPPPGERAFSLRAALLIAAVLTAVQLAARWAHASFGAQGLTVAAALAGLADVHAAAAALLVQLDPADAHLAAHAIVVPISLALAANTASKLVGAFAAGGPRFGARLAPGLLAMATAFALALWAAPVLLEKWAA